MAKRWQLSAILALAFLVAWVGSLEAHYFEIRDLGTLPATITPVPTAISDAGWVVGYCIDAQDKSHAFLWNDVGGMVPLGDLGGGESTALGINKSGQVVGWSKNSSGNKRAFLWTQQDGMQDLGTLGGAESIAYAIDELGDIVGEAQTADGHYRAFFKKAGRRMTNLGTLGGAWSKAMAINKVSKYFQVVGQSQNAGGGSRAFLWSSKRSNQLTDLGLLELGTWSSAQKINSLGEVVGVGDRDEADRAFLWTTLNGMENLGTLNSESNAKGINDKTLVVGTSVGSYFLDVRAFLWSRKKGMRDLNNMVNMPNGVLLTSAEGINNANQIIAGAFAINTPTSRAYLLTPVAIE